MAANLQIFMTNTASHCKGMWNLCVILALKKTIYFVSTPREHMSVSTENHMAATLTLISICLSFQDLQRKREECLGKVIRFFTVSTSRSRLEHLWVLTDRQKKKKHWDFSTFWSERAAWHLRCLSFYEKWKLRHLWPTYLSEDAGR